MYIFATGIIFGFAMALMIFQLRVYRVVRYFTPKKVIWSTGILVIVLIAGASTLQMTNPEIMRGAVVTSGDGGTSISFTCTGHLEKVQDFFMNSGLEPVAQETSTVFGENWPSKVCNDG